MSIMLILIIAIAVIKAAPNERTLMLIQPLLQI